MSLKPYAMIESAPTEEVLRRVFRADLWAHTSLKTPPEHCDPVFGTLFATLGVTGSFAIGSYTITYASLLSAITTTALSIGLQYLLAPKPPKPEDGKVPLKQAIPPRQWVVGRTRVAGAFMLWEAKGDYLVGVQAIAGHRIFAISQRWFHDDQITVNTDPETAIGPPNAAFGTVDAVTGGRYGNSQVLVDYRLGEDDPDPYDFIVDLFVGDDDPIWTNQHKGRGQASLAMKAQASSPERQAERYPYGAPQQSALVDGALCWDPRDSEQNPDDPSTWVWTRNAALILLWHQCFNEFGHRRDYHKAILPVVGIWKDEADICDEDVDLAAGGTEKRYWCSGFDTTDHDPKVGTNAILSACDGWLCERGDGALLFRVGKFREELVVTLADADIIGHQIQYDVLPEDECNRLVPKFTYPAIGYATADTDFFEDTDAQLLAGRVLAQDADYSWCHQWRQARRLGKRDWLRLQQKIKGSIDVRLSGINAVYARWIRLDTPIRMPSLDGKLIENRRSVLAITKGGFTMDFVKHPNDIDAWNPATDEGEMPPVPPAPNTVNLSAPVIDSIVPRLRGGQVNLKITFTDPENDSLGVVVRYRFADDGGSPGEWTEVRFETLNPSGGFVKVTVQNVPKDDSLDVQAAWYYSRKFSNYSTIETIDTTL